MRRSTNMASLEFKKDKESKSSNSDEEWDEKSERKRR